jgi:hypothetical protein
VTKAEPVTEIVTVTVTEPLESAVAVADAVALANPGCAGLPPTDLASPHPSFAACQRTQGLRVAGRKAV